MNQANNYGFIGVLLLSLFSASALAVATKSFPFQGATVVLIFSFVVNNKYEFSVREHKDYRNRSCLSGTYECISELVRAKVQYFLMSLLKRYLIYPSI